MDEKEILIKAQKGNFEAFEKLVFLYEKAIFRYISKMASAREDVEDLTQETFIKFYRYLKHIDPERGPKAFLYKIATNTVYDWLRKKRGQKELLIIDDPENPLETIDKNASYYNDRELNENIEELMLELETLRPAYKTALLLYYKEGLEYKEISEAMSIPINTVKTFMHRAKLELKQKIKTWTKKP